MIVPELYRLQRRCGYLPDDELRELSRRLGEPLYRLEEVASFFPHFHRTPPPRIAAAVCQDMSCRLRGAATVLAHLRDEHGDAPADQLHVGGASCLGRCDRAPAVAVTSQGHSHYYCGRSAGELSQVVAAFRRGETPAADRDADHQPAAHQSWRIDPYGRHAEWPPYEAVRRFVAARDREQHRDQIIQALETAGLLGMGGAGGRTYKKWSDVRQAPGDEKYVVCNGDESEPGTFKDRELLLRTPHLVLEGMIVAGLLLGARRGVVYIRHEYEEQIAAVEAAIAAAVRLGVCGERILDTPLGFSLEVFVSPGGYICGEQTALIEAIENRRAEPRNRPPELQTNGLYNKPTLLNNVETFAWVPAILLEDQGAWYAGQGAPGSKGLRLFSVSGDVERPGVVELPIGAAVGELLDACGGVAGGRALKGIALSGASGGFLPAEIPLAALPADARITTLGDTLDVRSLRLDLRVFRRLQLMLGGGIVVYAAGADLFDQAAGCVEFFQRESCGKCVPCRIGSEKLRDLCAEYRQAPPTAGQLARDRELVMELAQTMAVTAICGLGSVAATPLVSLMNFFPDELPTRRSEP